MNEITQVHLGRQAFTMAVDAQKLLRDYLRAVKTHSGGSDEVVEEVEIRMAELLIERGIGDGKVVLAKDVEYLKTQLGEPGDFDDDSEGATRSADEEPGGRRLYRDTENGMIAGVAAGLANYFKVDALLVRLIFVTAVLSGGWGIVVYILLWLLVPEAKTSSDTLKMRGKAVTVEALKDLVERADVPGATHRASRVAGGFLRVVGKALLAILGAGVTTAGAVLLFASVVAGMYVARHSHATFAGIFPVGSSEVLLVVASLVSAALIALLLLLTGVAMINRRWQLPNWGVAALAGLLLLSLAGGTALAADTVPDIRSRYIAAHHSVVREVQPFTSVSVIGSDANLVYEPSDKYTVELRYLGNPNIKPITTTVNGGVLTINTQSFAGHDDCRGLCMMFERYDLTIVVRSPDLPQDARLNNNTTMLVVPGEPIRTFYR